MRLLPSLFQIHLCQLPKTPENPNIQKLLEEIFQHLCRKWDNSLSREYWKYLFADLLSPLHSSSTWSLNLKVSQSLLFHYRCHSPMNDLLICVSNCCNLIKGIFLDWDSAINTLLTGSFCQKVPAITIFALGAFSFMYDINFVNDLYGTVKSPLNFILNRVSFINGVPQSPLPILDVQKWAE